MGGIKVTGLKNLEAKINQLPQRTMKGIEKAMEIIYQSSQPLVPVDTGRLKRSGKITQIDNGYQLKYKAVNPKNGYDYAPIQHENTKFKHKVGQAKYLEQPVATNMSKIKEVIAKEVVK